MEELLNLKEIVYKILTKIPETRNSDMLLYYEYCMNNWVRENDMWKVFKDKDFRKRKKISVFESVSRARRKVQEEHIELRATETIENLRKEREKNFVNFSLEK